MNQSDAAKSARPARTNQAEKERFIAGNNLYLPNNLPPATEREVVYLFKAVAGPFYSLSQIDIQNRFPDCLARKGKKLIRIEFEFESKNFRIHGHDPSQCDWIVCWRDTWGEEAPDHLEIVELRRQFSFSFNVWFQPLANEYAVAISEVNRDEGWSVPSKASEGDLLLIWRSAPQSCVLDLFVVDSPVDRVKAGWKRGYDYMATIARVATLSAPLTWSNMRAETRLSRAGFVNGAMAGRPRASAYWYVLLEMIITANPELAWLAERFCPDHIQRSP
jgi:hypothetical protein